MILKVIKSSTEHAAALLRVETLMADSAPNSPEEAELETWGVLIEKYEDEHFPIDLPDPVAAIQFRMEQRGLTNTDLQVFIPSRSKVSEVLNRKRPLSLTMIQALHDGLGIPSEVLLQPSRTRRGSKKLRPFGGANYKAGFGVKIRTTVGAKRTAAKRAKV